MHFSFSTHGQTKISVEGDIIIVESTGPWNLEYFEALHQELVMTIINSALDKYAVLLIPIGETIAVHEAKDFHTEFIKKGKACAIAVNLSQSETPLTTQKMCKEVYKEAALEHEFFTSTEKAKCWLKTKLQ
ncbi:MAG: hypothetical protein QF552_14575 [Litorilituus sp.]|jgi:hypothetical protein|nr:hypothetical protein [Litorilituus sp.]